MARPGGGEICDRRGYFGHATTTARGVRRAARAVYGARSLRAVAPVEVLDDPLGVRDRLALGDQDRHDSLAGESVDLGAVAFAEGHANGLVVDPVAAQLAGDA